MNKVIPLLFVVLFWGLYYVGTNNPNAGETIAFISVVCLLMLVLYYIKSYLLKKTNNNQK